MVYGVSQGSGGFFDEQYFLAAYDAFAVQYVRDCSLRYSCKFSDILDCSHTASSIAEGAETPKGKVREWYYIGY
ncbi:hypothetical protein SDC9_143075 [bioreactor metagenome]|uniref:Uncharacterized protein n=1 Tax=bioreactor metagenome TaxID=1076179 RepID=A0A645E305_9ZZZZ